MFFDVQSPSIKEKMCHAQSQTLSIKCAYSMSECIVLVVRMHMDYPFFIGY